MNLTNSYQCFNDLKKTWIEENQMPDSPTSVTSEEKCCKKQMKILEAAKILREDFGSLLSKQQHNMDCHQVMTKDEVSSHYKNILYDRLKYLSKAHKKLKKNQVIRKNQHILLGIKTKKKGSIVLQSDQE